MRERWGGGGGGGGVVKLPPGKKLEREQLTLVLYSSILYLYKQYVYNSSVASPQGDTRDKNNNNNNMNHNFRTNIMR